MMAGPDFTILLPTRNGGRYLDEAMRSVLAQSDPDWTLVVLEDASTDDTVERLGRYDDPRITVVRSAEPLSIRANWHRGVGWLEQHGAGDALVTFLGHDDLLAPDFVATIKALCVDHPSATLYQTHFDLIDAGGDTLRPCRPIGERESWRDLLAALCWGIRDSFGTGYVFRASDYRRVGGIPDLPLLLYSDHLLFTRLTRLGYKACAPDATFSYRLHVGSVSNGLAVTKLEAQASALIAFVDIIDREMTAFGDTDAGRAALASLLARELFFFETPMIRGRLSSDSRQGLDRLRARAEEAGRGLPLDRLIGPPTSNGRALLLLRRLGLASKMLRSRLRGGR